MNYKLLTVLIIVTLVAIFSRVLYLDTIPLGVYVDEAAQGYNAYSLLQTGKDEYGQPFPVFMRSFGAYTSALSLYFVIVPIKLLGLNTFALRLTPVIVGTLFSLVFTLLCGFLYPNRRLVAMMVGGLTVALLPTHILFSRGFFESPLSLLLFLLGLLCFVRHWPVRSALFFSLAAYAYQAQRLTVYLFALGLVVLLFKSWYQRKNIVFLMVFILSQIPMFYFSTLPGPSKRFLNLTWIPQIMTNSKTPIQFIWLASKEYLSQYISYYNPYYLFWSPDPDAQRSLPQLSVFYPWQIVVYLIGLLVLFKKSSHRKLYWWLLLVSPIAAAITKDPFSVLRASLIIIPTSLIVTDGSIQLITKFPGKLVWSIALVALFVSVAQLYRSLFILLPNERYTAWQYGYKELFSYIDNSPIPAVVDADKPVYILYLFYQKIDPIYVQSLTDILPANYYSQTDWSDYYHDPHVEFRKLDWKNDIYRPQLIAGNGLLVSKTQADEHFLQLRFKATSPIGEPLLFAYQTDPVAKCGSQVLKPPPCLLK